MTDHPHIVELLRTLVEPGARGGHLVAARRPARPHELVQALLARRSAGAHRRLRRRVERLRDLVDRKHSEEQLLRAASFAAGRGDGAAQGLQHGRPAGRRPTRTSTSWCASPASCRGSSRVALGVAPVRRQAQHARSTARPFAGIEEMEARLDRLRERRCRARPRSGPPPRAGPGSSTCWPSAAPEAGLAAHRRLARRRQLRRLEARLRGARCTPTLQARIPDTRRTPTQWPRIDGAPARPAA